MTVTAIVPLKALAHAKGRMAGYLDQTGRRGLVTWMLDRVLDACLNADAVGRVVVVAGDAQAAAEAARPGVEVVIETEDMWRNSVGSPRGVTDEGSPGRLTAGNPKMTCGIRSSAPALARFDTRTEAGLAAALALGNRAAAGPAATLVIPADLPLATAADIDAVCAAGSRVPSVVVVPTCDGGTGALLRRPGDVVGTAFGPGSASAHLRLAATAGIRAVRLDLPNLAFDVDTPADLRALDGRLPTVQGTQGRQGYQTS